jgi:hypothetical protein
MGICRSPKEAAALTERSLDEAFDKWWPDLEKKVEAISAAGQPPSEPPRSDRNFLEEIVENTRSLVRELPAPPPWLSFPQAAVPDSRVVPTLRALLQLEDKPAPGAWRRSWRTWRTYVEVRVML